MTEIERYQKLIRLGWTYNPKTGQFFNSRGKLCTNKNRDGYIQIGVLDADKKLHCIMAHRFAYYLYYNKVSNITDHINGSRDDNRIINLRSVDYKTNNRNQKFTKGYYYRKDYKNGAYTAQITVNGIVNYLGTYKTESEAKNAYKLAKNILHK